MHPGPHGSHGGRQEGTGGGRRWIPRERAVLEGLLLDVKGRGLVRSEAGHRRWGLGLLEGAAAGVCEHPGATLLGPQDGQRAGQAAQAAAARGEAEAPRHLDGRHARTCERGIRACSSRPTRRNTRRRSSAWRRTGKCLLAFYDFPAEHWIHLRTTNPIESTFATVRLRTAKTRGCGVTHKHSRDGVQAGQERRAAVG